MKYILSILLLWSMSACGQRDTTNVSIPGSGRITATTTPTLSYSLSIKFDTVRCIMLVCDTSLKYSTRVNYNKGTITIDSIGRKQMGYETDTLQMYYSNYVYWQYGYMILVDKSELLLTSGSMALDVPKSYLDANKKPLDQNIVVWQAIQVGLKYWRLYNGMEKQSTLGLGDFSLSSLGVVHDTSATHIIYLRSGNITYTRDNPPQLTIDVSGNVIIRDTTK